MSVAQKRVKPSSNVLQFPLRPTKTRQPSVPSKSGSREIVPLEKPMPVAPPFVLKELWSELSSRIYGISDDQEQILYWLKLIRATQELDIPQQLRDEIITRDKSVCCMCDFKISADEITVVFDLTPKRGGKCEASNLYAACLYCAGRKDGWTISQYRNETMFPRGHEGACILPRNG
jgi:hypothetical protein